MAAAYLAADAEDFPLAVSHVALDLAVDSVGVGPRAAGALPETALLAVADARLALREGARQRVGGVSAAGIRKVGTY